MEKCHCAKSKLTIEQLLKEMFVCESLFRTGCIDSEILFCEFYCVNFE